MRTLTLLNENGDTTIAWDESNDEKMIAIIQKKMDEGMTFFIMESAFFNLIPMKRKLKHTSELKSRQVFLKDEDFNSLILDGYAEPFKREGRGEIRTVGRAQTATQAARSNTIAIGQRQGG